ncbi:hypothetical protein ACMAZF_12625 [Psychrobium sp. nBUS_13]|uniref:hypothetical protein n=1 Tax=Psychrobium sp. nBUS_13 TaxID=3395319 RepID=UPI003EBF04F6
MTKNQRLKQKALFALGVLTGLTALYRMYDYMMADGQLLGVFSMSVLSISSFYWVNRYQKMGKGDYTVDKLITRDQDKMTFKGIPAGGYVTEKGIELDVNRLSILGIREDYLSVIIDGNGNGYDFILAGDGQAIESHIRSLLSEKEQENITFKRIK